MKKVIFVNAGHDTKDPGAVTQFGKEADFNREFRDALIPQLVRCGFEIMKVPDELNFKDSVKWVNMATVNIDDGLALAIHCNAGGGEGAETFYYGHHEGSKAIAKKLIDAYCAETGFKNRGARSDTLTRWKRLGWIRNTKVWATLIECGFLDNVYDVQKLKDYEKVAIGIAKGVCAIYDIPYIEENVEVTSLENKTIVDIIKILKRDKHI